MISIKHIILTGTGDECYPLGGTAVQCIVFDRSGNTTVDVPASVCIRGRVAGSLVLVGTGNVIQCGDLAVWQFDTDSLTGNFDDMGYSMIVSPNYADMGYLSKRFVAGGAARTSTWRVVQDARDYAHP